MNGQHRRRLAVLVLTAALTGCAGTTSDADPAPPPAPVALDAPATEPGTSSTTTSTTSTSIPPTTVATTAPRPAPTAAPAPARGATHSGRATHYVLEGNGNCLFPGYPGADKMFVAMNATDYGTADLCGAYLAVQGNRGSVTVKVIDQCPECPPGALDLSPEAFARVTGDPGVTNVQWRVISGPAQPAISFRIKDGSSQWWVGILAINHRNPVRSLDVMQGGKWVPLARQEWNYFVAEKGLGPGPYQVRLTDSYGERIVAGGITPDAERVFPTSLQFAGH